MTPAELRALLNAATPGPWESGVAICCPDRGWVTPAEHRHGTHWLSVEDANAIVALRNHADALLRVAEAAEKVLATAYDKTLVQDWHAHLAEKLTVLDRALAALREVKP
jgi:hypothetical protein